MPYETYTPSKDIRPNTRKFVLHKVWDACDEPAAHEANALFKQPVKDKTVKQWCDFQASGERSHGRNSNNLNHGRRW